MESKAEHHINKYSIIYIILCKEYHKSTTEDSNTNHPLFTQITNFHFQLALTRAEQSFCGVNNSLQPLVAH